jgi:hypothetical protein
MTATLISGGFRVLFWGLAAVGFIALLLLARDGTDLAYRQKGRPGSQPPWRRPS